MACMQFTVPVRAGIRTCTVLAACGALLACAPDSPRPASAQAMPAPDSRACPATTSPVALSGMAVCVEEITFSSGELTLAGQWFRPPGGHPVPAVVFVRGSGESSRGNAWTESLAAVLVQAGVGVLIPDKRGSGRSEGDWRSATFTDLATDAVAGVGHIAGREDVLADRVGLMGLSQGGQIVPIAAARSDAVAFVINVVGGAVPFLENVRFEMLHTFREEGLSGNRLEAAMSMVDTAIGHVVGSVPWDVYTAELHRTHGVLGDAIMRDYFIDTRDHWRWHFFRQLQDFDPVFWWREVEQPTLVLFGGADTNTPTSESAARLRGVFAETGHADATVLVFEGLGHDLFNHAGAMSGHGLDPEVRRSLQSWIRRVVREQQ